MGDLWMSGLASLLLRILLVLSTVDYVVLGIAATNIQDPRIVEHPEDKYVAKNEPATLNCKAEGEPPPVITWYRNGQPVTTAKENPTSHRMLLPNGQLFFLSIKHSKNNKPDVGLYYCNATNPRTGRWVASRNATLDIAVLRDDFKHTPQDQKVAVGDTVTLQCRPPRGLPEPRVSWKKDNTPVQIGGRIALESGANLVIMNAQKDDSGSYVCVASNMAGERESIPARLSVAEKPKFLKSPIDALKQENEDVEFHCRAVGDPAPTITWRKDEGSIPPGRSFILPDKSLQIRRVKVEDEGAYICRAENSVGYVEKLARLTVHSKPSFLVTPRNKVVGVGRTVTLRCQVTGNPPPAVFWNKEQSQTLMFPRQDHGRFSVLDEGTLIIQRVRKSDAGEYVCQALSVAGSALAKARLTVKDVDPRPPPIIHLGPQNQTLAVKSVAMLPCQASGDPPPSIAWFKDGANIQENNPRFTLLDSGTLQISDLRKGDTGVYTCRASSETGETTWSAALVVEMPSNPTVIFRRTPEPSTFPGPPSKPTVSNVGEHTLTLSWVPSSNQGASPVFAYMVEYFSHETGQGWTVASDNIRGKSYTVRGLRGDTSYMFLVRAINQHGTSLPSPVSEPVRTAVGSGKYVRPTMPSYDKEIVIPRLTGKVVTLNEASAMGPTDIHLSWRVEKSLRFIEGFHVKYRQMGAPHEHRRPPTGNQPYHNDYSTETIMGGKSSSYIIRNLQAYTWYEVKVQPFYQNLIGDDSNILTVQTKMKLPTSAPVNIQAKVTDQHFIYLTWETPPVHHFNGPLINFVAYCKANETKFDRNITIDPSNRSKIIKDTVPGMQYTIRMAITNEKGQGPLSKPVTVGGKRLWRSFVREPWFIATLIGTIGGTLWFALCVFSVWLYRKRKARKKGLKHGVVTVPVHKPDDPSRSDTVTNQTPLLSNHSELSTGNHSNQPLPSHPLLLAQNGSGDGSEPYITYGYPPPPDVTNMLAHKEEENLYNTPITPQMRTFYNKQNQQLPQCHPYATTTLITPNYVNSQSLQGNDSAFRPINAGYVHQGSCSSESCSKENSDSNCTDNGQQNADLIHDSHEPLISPVCSDVGSMSSELTRRSKQSNKNPVMNIADMLPPPPEHPPPSDIGTPPESPPTSRRDYEPGYSDQSSMHYHNAGPVMIAPKGSIHSLRAPVYDATPNHRLVMSDTERGPGVYQENRTPRAPSPQGAHSPVYRSLSPSAGHHVRTYAPGGSRLSDSEGPVRAYKLVPLNEQELASHYSDTERGNTPPVRIIHLAEGTPLVDAIDDPTMDRGCQSSLPSLVSEPHREPMTNGVQEGEYPENGVAEGEHRPDCLTPESSVGEGDESVTGSMLASWASVTDQSNSSCCSSNRSSAVSSSDGSFFAEADFASAVAKAAELSGLTVVGSTVSDPHSGAKKKKNYRHRPAKRPTSPYSTDSNFSAAPHKPYPKASRKKQLQQQANKYNSPNQPAFKPRPQTRAKPNMSSLAKENSQNGDVPSYSRPSYPATSPTSNGTTRSVVSRQSDRTPTNLTSGGDSDSTLRSNPLALLDSAQDTPIV